MKPIATGLALAASLAVLVAAGAVVRPAEARAAVDPTVGATLAAAAADQTVDVLVVLKSQEDVGAIRATTRAARVRAVVRALRARAAASQAGLLSLLRTRKAQGSVKKVVPLWVLDALEVEATPSVIEELAGRPEVKKILPNLEIQAPVSAATAASPEPNIDLVNADELWNLGIRGQGVVVASMDTGVDAGHPELGNRWRGGTNSWYDPNGEHSTTPTDVSGHGTSTMGVIVGGDAGGTSIGMAPDAKWIAVKIFNDHGVATTAGIHLGFQWLLDPDGNPSTADAPNVVNNSWTTSTFSCDLEFQPDLQSLRAAGIVPVFAVGNFGPGTSTVPSPANNPEALSVGSIDNSGALDASSGRGPSACSQSVAPDLVAPGVGIHTTDLFGLYTSATGTSLAAPHVTGALALLLSAFPNLTADQQEAALESGTVDLGPLGPDNSFGTGRLDALASYQLLASAPDFTISATPSTATAPAGGTASFDVTVAATGGFAGDVDLSLAGPLAASWAFSPVVIVGGSGTSHLDVTSAPDTPPGSYQLVIGGTSGSGTRTTEVTLVVPAPPDFTISATPSTATAPAGGTASFDVTVAGTGGFAGDVDLSLAGPSAASWTFSPVVIVGGSGTSHLDVTSAPDTPPGSYQLVIGGTSGSGTRTTEVTLVVSLPPDFTLSATPSSASVVAGATTSYQVGVGSLNGFAGSVALSLSGLAAANGSWSFSPPSISGAGSSQLTIVTSTTASAGTYSLTISGNADATSHSASVSLTILPTANFTLSLSPASRTVSRGKSTSYSVTVSSQNKFAGKVALSVSGLPSGAKAAFSKNPVKAPGTATLAIKTSGKTPPGTFTITVTGTSGTLTRSASAILIVK